MAVTAENPGWELIELQDFQKSFGFGFQSLEVIRSEPPVEFRVRLLEGAALDVILTRSGLSVTSASDLDRVSDPQLRIEASKTVQKTFESLESLLQTVSPMFRNRFAGQLAGKLAALAQLRELQSDDDEQEP